MSNIRIIIYIYIVTDEPWRLLGRPWDTTQLQIASCYPKREALGLAEGANGALCTVGAARQSCVSVPVGNWPPNGPHRLQLTVTIYIQYIYTISVGG